MGNVLYTGLDPSHFKSDKPIIHIPLIETTPLHPDSSDIQECLREFCAYTHIIITSKTTVPILKNLLSHFNYDLLDWQTKKTIAVGKATATFLQQNHITPHYIAKDETAEGIVEILSGLNEPNHYFFWPHSAQARPIITEYFSNKIYQYKECSLYETTTHFPEVLPDLNDFDEIVFTSPSTVKAFLEIFSAIPYDKILTCLGPVTSAFLKNL